MHIDSSRRCSRGPVIATIFTLGLFAACSDDDAGGGAGLSDSGSSPADASAPDTGVADTGVADSGAPDAGPADTGAIARTIDLPGLDGPVEVGFDARGVPSLRCQSDLDCFAAQGFLHASYRFGQMDLRRRAVRGGLSELAGAAAVETDVAALTFFADRMGQPLWEQLWTGASQATRDAITAYTRGVNAWIEDAQAGEHGARLTLEWDAFLDRLEPWTVEDSAACILALIEQLTNQSGTEIRKAGELTALPPAQAADFVGLRPASPATVLPAPRSVRLPGAALAGVKDLQASLRPYLGALARVKGPLDLFGGSAEDGFGSNNWVVAPSRTANGTALLANDPHLGMTNPSVWFVMNIDATAGGGSFHAAGASFAGLPAITLGQNEDIAWGATTTLFDMADVYLEQLSRDGRGVVFNGQTVPFVTRRVTIEVARGQPVTRDLAYVPHHGPVVSIDPRAGTAVTIRWTAQDATRDLDLFLGLGTASSVDEAQTVLRDTVSTAGQNFVVADRQGNIGWFPYNTLPARPWASPRRPSWLPLPGTGEFEWMGTLANADIPQAKNPPEGVIATANNDMTGALWDGEPTNDGRPMLQHFVATGYRQERILEVLAEGGNAHDLSTMQALQSDTRVLIGERLVPGILARARDPQANLSRAAMAVVGALEGWDFSCPTGLAGPRPDAMPVTDVAELAASAGCTAFHVLFPRLLTGVFGDELAAAGLDRFPNVAALVDAFTRPSRLVGGPYWDDVNTRATETSTQTVGAAIESAATYLRDNLGPTASSWQWGRLHVLTLRAQLFDDAGLTVFNNGPWANDGGLFTVDVANPANAAADDYGQRSGASMRFACELGSSGVDCTMQLPGGQRHFEGDPNLQDLLLEYLSNTSFDLPFTPAEVDATRVEAWTLR